jgi:PKD domain
MGRLRLAVVLAALCSGCAGDENPAGPGTVTVTVSTTTTTTTTVAPTATAQFVFAPTAPAAQQPVFFNAFGSTPGRGTKIVTFSWDFGDGGTGTGMSLSHTYADMALYVVTLTVTDDVGDSAKVSQIIGAIAPPVTTTIPPAPPAASAAQYVGNQTNPIIPSDLTLFFRLLTSASPLPEGNDAAGLQAVDGDFTYTVTGTFKTPNGTTGTITGRLEGVVEPKPAGDFTGRLIANPTGCSATRNFSGPITATSLQWDAGSMVRNTCATNPLGFTSLSLVQTNAPPVTTTSSTTTTTTTTTTIPAPPPPTTIPIPPLTGGTITSSPSGTGLLNATDYSFSYTTPPTGGVPPYTYSWSFGDGGTASGPSPTHVFSLSAGKYSVQAAVTDSRGVTAGTSTAVVIGDITDVWYVSYPTGAAKFTDSLDIFQSQAQVFGSVRHGSCVAGPVIPGSVSNPRSLSVSWPLTCGNTTLTVSYQGTLNSALSVWTGTITGGNTGCSSPCPFTGTRAVVELQDRRAR